MLARCLAAQGDVCPVSVSRLRRAAPNTFVFLMVVAILLAEGALPILASKYRFSVPESAASAVYMHHKNFQGGRSRGRPGGRDGSGGGRDGSSEGRESLRSENRGSNVAGLTADLGSSSLKTDMVYPASGAGSDGGDMSRSEDVTFHKPKIHMRTFVTHRGHPLSKERGLPRGRTRSVLRGFSHYRKMHSNENRLHSDSIGIVGNKRKVDVQNKPPAKIRHLDDGSLQESAQYQKTGENSRNSISKKDVNTLSSTQTIPSSLSSNSSSSSSTSVSPNLSPLSLLQKRPSYISYYSSNRKTIKKSGPQTSPSQTCKVDSCERNKRNSNANIAACHFLESSDCTELISQNINITQHQCLRYYSNYTDDYLNKFCNLILKQNGKLTTESMVDELNDVHFLRHCQSFRRHSFNTTRLEELIGCPEEQTFVDYLTELLELLGNSCVAEQGINDFIGIISHYDCNSSYSVKWRCENCTVS